MTFEVLQVATELEEAVALYRAVKPKRVLEIGVWQGGTLREWILYAAPGAEIAAVDLEHPNRDEYETWRAQRFAAPRLRLHMGMSQELPAVTFMQQHGPYDWAFIDGDHGTWGVTADVANVEPLMAPGGHLLLHDIAPPAGTPTYPPGDQFRSFQARSGFRTWAFVHGEPGPVSHGIGVVKFS